MYSLIKNKKILLGMLLFAAILCSGILASAQESRVVTLTGGSSYPGDSITVNVILDNPEGIAGIQCTIAYDSKILDIENKDITIGEALNKFTYDSNVIKEKSYLKFSAAASKGIEAKGGITLFSMRFKVKDAAAIGQTVVKADYVFACNDALEQIPTDSRNSIINIVKKGSTQGQTPSGGKPETPAAGTPAPERDGSMEIIIDGESQESFAVMSTREDGGKTVATVTLESEKLKEKLQNVKSKAVIAIPVRTGSGTVITEFYGDMAKLMELRETILKIDTGDAVYNLPVSEINIDELANAIGNNKRMQEIKVHIEISKDLEQGGRLLKDSAKKDGLTVTVPPISFIVKATFEDKTVVTERFNTYVERLLAIPEGTDPHKITTGVVVGANGTIRHVPTKVVFIDGRYYAKISSLTNSIYSAVWNPYEFKDVKNHWAKSAVNNMGARLIMVENENGIFNPSDSITRAEFAAVMIRALGLEPKQGENIFNDVKETQWYAGYINTACEYGIIGGYGNGKFGPEDKITRGQAMIILSRAMSITGLSADLKAGEAEDLLNEYKDMEDTAAWARESIAACIKTGIINGKIGKLIAPEDKITRCEVAIIVERLLKKSDLI
ncbi:S-layer family protein [Anaerobacterium chartisolvens]|uniref:S-layer family protein n=1 Tax=Anaerobacterium chartisolvens TaxID=1297424 RepID=A0A369B576_9FIRM|nr:S-layer homology domain-containing protein [Anaerobacterium chartisolvens]RCX16643.1 S-layer family protein [Anaerobacterium chartisolvens]